MRRSTKSDPSCHREPEKLSITRLGVVKNNSRKKIAGLSIGYKLVGRCYTAAYRSEQLAVVRMTYRSFRWRMRVIDRPCGSGSEYRGLTFIHVIFAFTSHNLVAYFLLHCYPNHDHDHDHNPRKDGRRPPNIVWETLCPSSHGDIPKVPPRYRRVGYCRATVPHLLIWSSTEGLWQRWERSRHPDR